MYPRNQPIATHSIKRAIRVRLMISTAWTTGNSSKAEATPEDALCGEALGMCARAHYPGCPNPVGAMRLTARDDRHDDNA
jgi:hypothetical protein